jgi:glycosyltransferase involved in cell wall biosynthesis
MRSRSRRIRILAFVTDFRVGGTERQFATFARALDPSRFELHLACFRRLGQFLEDILPYVASVHEYQIRRLYHPGTLVSLLEFARDLRKLEIDVFQAYGFYPNVFGLPAARLARVPVALGAIRDTGDHLTPSRRRLQKLACRLATGVLVNAEAVRENLLAQGYEGRRICVVPNGISVERFAGTDTNPREGLGIERDAPIVTLLGRLNELKGADYFIEAASLVAKRFPKARFLVVGDGAPSAGPSYRQGLECYARMLGLSERMVFAGLRSDVPALLVHSQVLVQPSLSEGLSNVLLESMAAGVPVVATRVGGNPEVVEEEVSGILVPPRDAGALAQGIERLLSDPDLALRMGRAGRERVKARFSVEQMVRRTEDVYEGHLEASSSLPVFRPSAGAELSRCVPPEPERAEK